MLEITKEVHEPENSNDESLNEMENVGITRTSTSDDDETNKMKHSSDKELNQHEEIDEEFIEMEETSSKESKTGVSEDPIVAAPAYPTTHQRCHGSLRHVSQSALSNLRREIIKRLSKFWSVKLCQALCAIFILLYVLAGFGMFGEDTRMIGDVQVDVDAGIILYNGDERAIVTANKFQRFCFTMSRLLAFSMYPVLVLVYLSKCRGTMTFLRRSPFYVYMFKDTHELHIYCGKYIAVAGILHSLFHCIRWIDQGHLNLLFDNRSGITGFISFICLLFIVFPMLYFKRAIKYEIRKMVHYLFFVMAIALALHSPPSAIPNGGFAPYVFSIVIIYYTLDFAYVYFFMTENIETTIFQVLPTGVQMSIEVSDHFYHRGGHGGFAYVCLPWVDRNQWHAFSLFQNPENPKVVQVFLMSVGDWTTQVHKYLERDTRRPVLIQGPFSSPYGHAASYDNQIMVASGIGVTPALSIISAHKSSRRTNLIWAIRDASMLEFFLEHLYLDHSGWNLIFYTGHTPLNPILESLNTNVRIIKGRPCFVDIIPNIIYGIETGKGMPENYLPEQLSEIKEELVLRMMELDKTNLSANEKLSELRDFVSGKGFLFTDLVASLEEQMMKTQDHIAISHRTSVMRHSTNSSEILSVIRALDNDPATPHSSIRTSSSLRSSTKPIGVRRRSNAHRVPRRDRASLMWSAIRKDNPNTSLMSPFNPCNESKEARDYVKALDVNKVLSTWGILYCGGSKAVEQALKGISEEYHIDFHSESFEW